MAEKLEKLGVDEPEDETDIPDLEDNDQVIDVKIKPAGSSIFSNTTDNIAAGE